MDNSVSHTPKGNTSNPTIAIPSHQQQSDTSPTARFGDVAASSSGGDATVATPSCVLSALLRRTLFDAMSHSGSSNNSTGRSISSSSSSSGVEERQTAADGILASLGVTQGMVDIRLLLQQAVIGDEHTAATTATTMTSTTNTNGKGDYDTGAWLTRMFSGTNADPQTTSSAETDATTISPQARLEMLSRAGMADVANEAGTSAEAVESAVNFLLRQSSTEEFGARLASAVDRVTDRILSGRVDVTIPEGSRFNDGVTSTNNTITTTPSSSSPISSSSLAQQAPPTQQPTHHSSSRTTLLVRRSSQQQTPPPTPPPTQGMQQQQWRGSTTVTTPINTITTLSPSGTTTAHHHTISSPFSHEFSQQVLDAVRVLHSNGSGPRPSYTLAPLPTDDSSQHPTTSRSTILASTPIVSKTPTTTILRQGSARSNTTENNNSNNNSQEGADVEVRLSLLNASIPSSSNLQLAAAAAGEDHNGSVEGRGTSPHVLLASNKNNTPTMDVREINPLHLVTSATPITASSLSASFYPSRELALACKGYDKQLEYATITDDDAATIVTSVPLRNRSLVIGADRPSTITTTNTDSGEVEKTIHFDGRKVYNTFLQDDDVGKSSLLELMRAVPEPHTRNLYVVADPCLPINPFFDVDASEWDTSPPLIKHTAENEEGVPPPLSLQHTLIQPLLLAHNINLPDTTTNTTTTSAWATSSVEVIAWLVSKCIEEAVGRYFGVVVGSGGGGDNTSSSSTPHLLPVSIFSSCAPVSATTGNKVKLSLHLHFPSPQTTFANIQEHRLFVEEYLLCGHGGTRGGGAAAACSSSYPTFTSQIARLLGVDASIGGALLEELLRTVIDAGVYTKWRLFRLPFCCKGFSFSTSTTTPLQHQTAISTAATAEGDALLPLGRTSSSAALETIQEKDVFLDQLNNYHHHHNNNTTTPTPNSHHRLVTAAKDVLSCGFASRGSLRFLLPLIVPATTNDDDEDGGTSNNDSAAHYTRYHIHTS